MRSIFPFYPVTFWYQPCKCPSQYLPLSVSLTALCPLMPCHPTLSIWSSTARQLSARLRSSQCTIQICTLYLLLRHFSSVWGDFSCNCVFYPALCTFLSPVNPVSVFFTTFLHVPLSLLINFVLSFFSLFAFFLKMCFACLSNMICLSVSLHLTSHLSLGVCGAYRPSCVYQSCLHSHKDDSFSVSALFSALWQ